MPSCTLHELQEPQSPTPATTKSQVLARSLIISGSAGLEADGLRRRTTSVKPYCACKMAATASNMFPALDLLLSSSPTRLACSPDSRGASDDSATSASFCGL